jgi:hypothetical protein
LEKLDAENTFEFEQVSLNNEQNGIILYDPNRNVFVELNEFNSNFGDEKTNFRPLYTGRWLNKDFADRLRLMFDQNNNDNNTQGNNNLPLNDAISSNFVSEETPQSK